MTHHDLFNIHAEHALSHLSVANGESDNVEGFTSSSLLPSNPLFWFSQFASIPLHPLPHNVPLPSQLASLYPIVVQPAFPFLTAAAYLALVSSLSALSDGKDRIRAAGRWGRALVVVHNAILAAYSAWSFLGTGPMIAAALWRGAAEGGWDGFKWATCDADGAIWQRALGDYTYVFYLSKMWEFLDTAILLLKGKKPEVLQTFHHAGAIIGTWAGLRYQASPVWLFVVFNSLVHTFMYTYFTLTTLRIRVPRALKQAMTTLQIAQFLTGLSFSIIYPLVRVPSESPMDGSPLAAGRSDSCLRDAGQSFALWFSDAYVVVLTVLFYAFYRRTYAPATASTKATVKTTPKSRPAVVAVKETVEELESPLVSSASESSDSDGTAPNSPMALTMTPGRYNLRARKSLKAESLDVTR